MWRKTQVEDKHFTAAPTLLERAQATMEAADADYQDAVRALHELEFTQEPARRAARQSPEYGAALAAARLRQLAVDLAELGVQVGRAVRT